MPKLIQRAKANPKDLGYLESALVILHRLAKSTTPDIIRPYVAHFQCVMGLSLKETTINSLGYEALKALLNLDSLVRDIVPDSLSPKSDAIDRFIHRRIAFNCFLVGDISEGLEHLFRSLSQISDDLRSRLLALSPSPASSQAAGLADEEESSEARTLQRAIALASSNKEVQEALISFRDEWVASIEDSGASALHCAMVSDVTSTGAFTLGRIIGLQGELIATGEWSLLKNFMPGITFDKRIMNPNDPFAQQIRASIEYAETYFVNELGIREIPKFPREYRFAIQKHAALASVQECFTGASAGLGFSLLAIESLDRLPLRRRALKVRTHSVFTGSVDESGHVKEVAEEGIPAKVRAVFYSPFRFFVVPRGNAASALRALSELKRSHPNRSLEIVPASHIRDAFTEPKITVFSQVSYRRLLFERAKRRRKQVVTIASMSLAILVGGIILPLKYQSEIESAGVQDGILAFTNPWGHVFKEYRLPYQLKQFDKVSDPHKARGCDLYVDDLNGDGRKECLFLAVNSKVVGSDPAGRMNVYLYSHKGKLIKHTTLLDSLVAIEGDSTFRYDNFLLYQNQVFDFDDDGSKELVILAKDYIGSPGAIICLSLKNWRYQTFINRGHLNEFMIMDFDKDGRPDILAAGTSNHGDEHEELDRSIVVVLDPLEMEGSSPSSEGLYFRDHCQDISKWYVQIPRSALCPYPELPESGCQRPEINRINHLREGSVSFGSMEGTRSILFYFNGKMECTGVAATDTYASLYESMRVKHALRPLQEYMETLRRGVRYWDGGTWVDKPTPNRAHCFSRAVSPK